MPGWLFKLRSNLAYALIRLSVIGQQCRMGCESMVLRYIYLFFWKPYSYAPLPSPTHLRRCNIQPGNLTDRLVVIIDTVPFEVDSRAEESSTYYEALSYTWGSEDHPLPVLVGSKTGPDTTLFVTRNLHCALQNLRRPDKPRIMWIDAICINQKDNVEKGPQVAMMGTIYRKANRVVVWLGPEADNSNYAMSLMESWGSQIDTKFVDSGTGKIYPASDTCDDDLTNLLKPLLLSKEKIKTLTAFMQRPWFCRLWIRQEIALAKANAVVSCGQIEVPWTTLRKALYFLGQKTVHPDIITWETIQDYHTFSDVKGKTFELASQKRVVSLLDLTRSFRSALCKDPRDRIYAVLGMLKKGYAEDLKITADYTKNCHEVYKSAFLRYTEVNDLLDMLGECKPADKEALAAAIAPSWVPDWSRTSIELNDPRTNASSHVAPLYSLPDAGNQDVLRVAGVVITEVGAVSPMFPPAEREFEAMHTLRQALSTVAAGDQNTNQYKPDLNALADIYARALLMGHGPEIVHPEDHARGMDVYVELLRDILTGETESYEGNNPPPSAKNDALSIMSRRIRNRRFGWPYVSSTTRDESQLQYERPIICPSEAQQGDLVAVILGCARPILLRPFLERGGDDNDSKEKFAVLGSCFMTEALGGEAILGSLPDGIRAASIRAMNYQWGFVEENTEYTSYFDPRLEVDGLGFDVKHESRIRQNMPDGVLKVEFEPMRELIKERTGRELRWLDLA